MNVRSPMAAPRLVKVVVDMGIGEAATNRELLDNTAAELASITGQKPQTRMAKQAISGFGIRQGSPVGLRATLRGGRMRAFLEKFIKIVLPRLRDFRGVKTGSFDRQGNFSIGIADYSIFPEIDITKVGKNRGLGITIVTTAKNNEETKRLLEELGMPFEKSKARSTKS